VAVLNTLKAWRNAIFGTLLVLLGIGAAALTAFSSRGGDPRLTSTAAIAALVIVGLIVIFVLPPLARSAGAEFAQIDLPLQVTPGGMIFVGLIVVVGFAAFNTGNNLLFLVLAILVSTLFVSFVAAQITLRNLVVSARFPDHIFAGDPAPVVVTLRNTKRFSPSLSVLVEARGPKAEPRESNKRRRARLKHKNRILGYFPFVPHRAAAEQKVEQLFEKRGHELITGFELSTRAPFGFLRHRRRLRARNVDIVILPKPEAVADRLNLLPMNTGRLLTRRRGAGHDLLSLRDYQPHDDLRHIDWKATARSRQLMIREFAAEDERRVNIWLDTRPVEPAEEDAEGESQTNKAEERFEFAVTQAASLVAHFVEERAEVRLILGSDGGRIGVGKQHLYDCLKRLALVEPAPSADLFSSPENYQAIFPADGSFTILLTSIPSGTIPAEVWRASHVIYF
jgi:uncharacterized protein (DUF58 family)